MLDEDDLAGRDALTALRPLVGTIMQSTRRRRSSSARRARRKFSRWNVAGCAAPLERDFGVRVYPARMDGFDASYTEGEDHVLGAMLARAPRTDEANLVILGCLSALEEAEIAIECAAMGLPKPQFLPGESALDVPAVGKNTVLAPVHRICTGRVRPRHANASAGAVRCSFRTAPTARARSTKA